MDPGDVVLVAFPFADGIQAKHRPALVVLDTGDVDVVVARITTRLYRSPLDVEITDWSAAGLLAPSVIRLHKLATLERTLVGRQLGRLARADRERVAAVMRRTFGAW